MSDRIDLSADTHIDGEYLVTTDGPLARTWPLGKIEVFMKVRGEYQWVIAGDLRQLFVHSEYRIPRAIARERYQYVEGEPCCYLDEQGSIRVAICSFGPASQTGLLALRALLVCGGSPKSLHILYEWIIEVLHE